MTADASGSSSYVETFLPLETIRVLEAGAYGQLCEHLRQRSEEVQNIDLMTVSGFCRNCLAKWLVVEARRLSKELKANSGESSTIKSLDALGYDEAAEYVYGMQYGDWKKRYAKKATEEVMEKYNASKSIHATHDKELLATKGEKPEIPKNEASNKNPTLLSNVCCQDPELVAATPSQPTDPPAVKTTRVVSPQAVPLPPCDKQFKLGILTISDRASKGEYESGDLSGAAVASSVAQQGKDTVEIFKTKVVPDDVEAIQQTLKEWSANAAVDLILTTGGTGFAPRDVTPEATTAILDQECHGFMSYIASECSKIQPLSALSRGTAGVLGSTLVCNLPGNPKAVEEIVPLLLPLALHAIVDLQQV